MASASAGIFVGSLFGGGLTIAGIFLDEPGFGSYGSGIIFAAVGRRLSGTGIAVTGIDLVGISGIGVAGIGGITIARTFGGIRRFGGLKLYGRKI